MNSKQRLFFIGEMCLGMATIMSLIGHLLATGWSQVTLNAFLLSWLPTVLLAYFYNVFVASQITSLLIRWFTRHIKDQEIALQRATKLRSAILITIMCPSMSLFALLMAGQPIVWSAFLIDALRSLAIALVIRAVLVRPLAQKGLTRMNPHLLTAK